jgi:3-hydroxybutyryl-CoA dehydratase
MARYFEDFDAGEKFVTRSRTITESDVVQFAALTGDFTFLHVDAVAAATTPFGQRIAHGALIYSYSIGLTTQLNLLEGTVIAFYGLDRLRSIRPTFFGDTIHVEKIVTALDRKDKGGLITYDTQVVNQHQESVMVYSDKVLVRYRNGG